MSLESPTLEHRLPDRRARRFKPCKDCYKLAATVLLLASCTVALMLELHRRTGVADEQHFHVLEQRLHTEIQRRVMVYRYGLAGTRSAIAAVPQINQHTFDQVVAARDLPHEFPATNGMCYIERVSPEHMPEYLARRRADDRPSFTPWTIGQEYANGDGDHMIVSYAAPASADRAATGFDIACEQRRLTAAMTAARTGKVAITQRINLVTPGNEGPGFLMLVPYYGQSLTPATEAQRLSSLRGWVGMTILSDRVFQDITTIVDDELSLHVYDADDADPQHLLYQSAHDPAACADHDTHESVLTIGGRQWAMCIAHSSHFKHASNASVWLAGSTGLFVTLLLMGLFVSQQLTKVRAQHIAEQLTAEHRQLALTDQLTGLPNRTAINTRINQCIQRARREHAFQFAVLFIDFDRFKQINDELGHAAGDVLLQNIAHRLQSVLRPYDVMSRLTPSDRGYENTAARLGGDEFIILLENIDGHATATTVADRLIESLQQPHTLGHRELISTASIGIAMGDHNARDATTMIRNADTAMYAAKHAGKNQHMTYAPDSALLATRPSLETELHNALTSSDQLYLVYQPVIDLRTFKIEGFEALLRWTHPQLGPISPMDFIPIAEESDLIVQIDDWVITHAAKQCRQWLNQGIMRPDQSLSINLSRRSVDSAGLADRVSQMLQLVSVKPAQINFEITERGVMADPTAAAETLSQLRAVGHRIHLDDFGAGQSSLACITRLPVDVLKFDREFVSGFTQDPHRHQLLKALVNLCDEMGYTMIAEGVETAEELNKLIAMGCAHAQGYYLGKPQSARDASTLIHGRFPHMQAA